MKIKERTEKDIVIVEPSGEVDFYNSSAMRERFDNLTKQKRKTILVNLVKVTYIDSSGLATLIELMQKMNKYGGKLKLSGLNQTVRDVFEVSKLINVFSIYPDEQEALKAFMTP